MKPCGIKITISKQVLVLFGARRTCPETGAAADSAPPEAAGLRSCFLVTKLKRGDGAKINSAGSYKYSPKDRHIHPAPASFTDHICSPNSAKTGAEHVRHHGPHQYLQIKGLLACVLLLRCVIRGAAGTQPFLYRVKN